MGLTCYYRRFVANYGQIAAPLTRLTKKDEFRWTEEASEASQILKEAMTKVPVLALPNFGIPFVLETDASWYGIRAVLMQEQRLLAYLSQKQSRQAQAKSVYERKLMAIVFAVQKWRHYLLGSHFIFCTDQKSLKHLLEQREVQPNDSKWLIKLLGYDFEIIYKPGLE